MPDTDEYFMFADTGCDPGCDPGYDPVPYYTPAPKQETKYVPAKGRRCEYCNGYVNRERIEDYGTCGNCGAPIDDEDGAELSEEFKWKSAMSMIQQQGGYVKEYDGYDDDLLTQDLPTQPESIIRKIQKLFYTRGPIK